MLVHSFGSCIIETNEMWIKSSHDQILLIESQVDRIKISQASEEQARSSDQCERDRQLSCHKQTTKRKSCRQVGSLGSPENLIRINAGCAQCRDYTEEQCIEDTDRRDEEQQAEVPMHSARRNLETGTRAKFKRYVARENCEPYTDRASEHGEKEALGKKLPNDAFAAGAKAQTDCDLPSPHAGFRQQQTCDVCTGDQHHQGDDRHQRE